MFRELVRTAAGIPPQEWGDLEATAGEVTALSILPVVGAGASRDCDAPLASELAKKLFAEAKQGPLQLGKPPSDFEGLEADLGKVADALRLENSPEAIVRALGFEDTGRWPSPEDVFEAFERDPHTCVYRVLARLAKESLLTEAVSFNYDCHFEGGLLKEGFFAGQSRPAGRWPERYSVIANAEQNADVSRRGEFTLNKVHGCAQTWRQSTDRVRASNAIVVCWSQLLDWRDDQWARDLFRDRARRHVLFLLGFSGMDPVIHSTLQAIMRELRRDGRLEGPSRVRVVDVKPETLTLKMLAESGRTGSDDLYFEVNDLSSTILALYVLLVKNRLDDHARSHGRSLRLPVEREDVLRRIAIAGPAMLRWTWSVLANTQAATGLRGLLQRRDDYYVPLTADPERTLIAFDVREQIASRYGVEADADQPDELGGFVAAPRAGRAFMPLGLLRGEAEQIVASGDLTHLPVVLRSPLGRLDRIVVAHGERGLRGFSLETGREVDV